MDPIWEILRHRERSQAWLARHLHVDRALVTRWKQGRGKPTSEQRAQIAVLLGMPESVLFRGEQAA